MIKKRSNLFKFTISAFFIVQILIGITVFNPIFRSANIHEAQAADTGFANDPLDFTPQISIPGSKFQAGTPVESGEYNNKTGNMSSNLLATYVISFYNYGLAFSGILATLILMGAGIIWLSSGGDSGKITQAKKLITSAIVGLLILVCAWMILNTINPNLTKLSNIETQVVKRKEISVINCCNSKIGLTVVPVDIVNGQKVFASGENKGKPIKCAAGNTECSKEEACVMANTNGAFSCEDTSKFECCEYSANGIFNNRTYCVPVIKQTTCPAAGAVKDSVFPTYTFGLSARLDSYCSMGGKNSGGCSSKEKNKGESCGNEGGVCYEGATCPMKLIELKAIALVMLTEVNAQILHQPTVIIKSAIKILVGLASVAELSQGQFAKLKSTK